MANKIIDKNKINKEPKDNRIANDRGVGSTDFVRHLIVTSFIRFNTDFHTDLIP
ncbi:MAG: hypothetical protein GY797_38565 [Deltaproteobacteria bacterium]|nr:hypothetical protein [Deltaproteobacteria bacterium]